MEKPPEAIRATSRSCPVSADRRWTSAVARSTASRWAGSLHRPPEVVELERQGVQRRTEFVAGDRDERVPDLNRLLRFLVQALELRLGMLAFGDVARDLGGADHLAGGVLDGRDRQGDRDQIAVLRDADGLEMLDAFAPPDAVQDQRHVLLVPGRHQGRDGLPDDLCRLVSEEALGPRVPGRDDPLQVLGDDRVLGGIHDGDETLPFLFAALLLRGVLKEDGDAVAGWDRRSARTSGSNVGENVSNPAARRLPARGGCARGPRPRGDRARGRRCPEAPRGWPSIASACGFR